VIRRTFLARVFGVSAVATVPVIDMAPKPVLPPLPDASVFEPGRLLTSAPFVAMLAELKRLRHERGEA